jgi:hypothetical protein
MTDDEERRIRNEIVEEAARVYDDYAEGMQIYAQANWPKVQDGVRKVRFPSHPLIIWLSRWLPITPYIEGTYPRFKDADPVIAGNKIFCSLAQYDYIKRSCARPVTTGSPTTWASSTSSGWAGGFSRL